MSTINQPTLEELRRLRSRRSVTELSYQRTLRALATTMTQSELAAELHVTQSAVSQALKTARAVDDVRPGFSGASPYEIAQRYAAGSCTAIMRWRSSCAGRTTRSRAATGTTPGRRRARDAHARGGRARLPRGTDRPGHVCRGGPGAPDDLGSQAVTTAAEVDRHAQTVRALSAPGAPLSRESPHATIANPAWFFTPGCPPRCARSCTGRSSVASAPRWRPRSRTTSARSCSPGRPAPVSHGSWES